MLNSPVDRCKIGKRGYEASLNQKKRCKNKLTSRKKHRTQVTQGMTLQLNDDDDD